MISKTLLPKSIRGYYELRNNAKPGITGCGRSQEEGSKLKEMVLLDLYI